MATRCTKCGKDIIYCPHCKKELGHQWTPAEMSQKAATNGRKRQMTSQQGRDTVNARWGKHRKMKGK